MNETATRPDPSRANAIAMPAIVNEEIARGAAAGRTPHAKSPMCRSLPFIGGPALPICGVEDAADGLLFRPHRERRAQIADQRRDDVASPGAVFGAKTRTAAQPNHGGVDGFLTQRAKALPLKRGVLVADLACREEGLQTVVGRARQHHAAQDLEPLLFGERGRDRLAAQKAVAGVEQLRARLMEAFLDRDAGRRFRKSLRRRTGQLATQGLRERFSQRLDRVGVSAGIAAADAVQGGERRPQSERLTLGDERGQALHERRPFERGRRGGLGRAFHGMRC